MWTFVLGLGRASSHPHGTSQLTLLTRGKKFIVKILERREVHAYRVAIVPRPLRTPVAFSSPL